MDSMNRTLAVMSAAALMGAWIPVTASAQTETEPQGELTVTYETFEVDFGGDGTVELLERTTEVYDANGNLLSRNTRALCDNGVGNGPDCRPGRARFNNDDVGGVPGAPGARDKIAYETFEVDFDGDGTVDYFERTTKVYDANGKLVSSHTEAQ